MTTTAVLQHQSSDVGGVGSVQNRFADRQHCHARLTTSQQVNRNVAFRQQSIRQKSVTAVDHVFLTQINHSHVSVDPGTTRHLFAIVLSLQVVKLDSLTHILQRENFVNTVTAAEIHQSHHQLIVGDAEVAKSAKSRSRIHHKVQQIPSTRSQDVFPSEPGRITFIDGFHHLVTDVSKSSSTAKIVVDHACCGVRVRVQNVVLANDVPVSQCLAVMVIKTKVARWDVGQICDDVA